MDRSVFRYVATNLSWQVVLLVAGLFVIVAGLERIGSLGAIQHLFELAAHLGNTLGVLAIGAGTTIANGLFNSLPVAPATLLWLIVLRCNGIVVTPLHFLRMGLFITVPTLLVALLLVRS